MNATQYRTRGTQAATREASSLDATIAATQTKQQQIVSTLESAVQKIEAVLPPQWKGHARRFVKRAALYFARKSELSTCTNASFIQAVLDAAELGLAIDGRLCHAVKYGNKKRIDGKDVWIDEAQCMVDYKGLIAVAKRVDAIGDIEADVVRENDDFEFGRENDTTHLTHRYDIRHPRGAVVGAYARVWLPNGTWRCDVMQLDELHAIRGRSKSYTGKYGPSGPWLTDEGEMMKKTVLRRLLKTLADDPGVAAAMDVDDRDYEDLAEVIAETERRQTATVRGRKVAVRTAEAILCNGADVSDSEVVDDDPREYVEGEPEAKEPSIIEQYQDQIKECEDVESCKFLAKAIEQSKQLQPEKRKDLLDSLAVKQRRLLEKQLKQ